MEPDLYSSEIHTMRTILCPHRISQKCFKIAFRGINRIAVKIQENLNEMDIYISEI